MTDFKILQEKYPFLTLFRYAQQEYLGIIQNRGKSVVSAYVYNHIQPKGLRLKFLELGETWWWESNRKIPINLFLKPDFDIFRGCLKNFVSKEVEIIHGPSVSIQNLSERRVKRRRVELVRDPNIR